MGKDKWRESSAVALSLDWGRVQPPACIPEGCPDLWEPLCMAWPWLLWGHGVVGASGWLPSTSQDFFCVAVGIVGSFWNPPGPPLLPRDDAGSCRCFVSCRALRGRGELPRCPSSEVPACWGNVCGVLLGTHMALPFPPGCTRAGPGARVPWALLVVPWEKLKPPGSPDRERDGERCLLNLEPTQETNNQTPQQNNKSQAPN